MKRSRQITRPWPGEFIRVGLVFDQRMSKFHNGKVDGGTWRVKWVSVQGNPLIREVMNIDGVKQLRMNVARLLRVGDLCNPKKLALEYVEWMRNLPCATIRAGSDPSPSSVSQPTAEA